MNTLADDEPKALMENDCVTSFLSEEDLELFLESIPPPPPITLPTTTPPVRQAVPYMIVPAVPDISKQHTNSCYQTLMLMKGLKQKCMKITNAILNDQNDEKETSTHLTALQEVIKIMTGIQSNIRRYVQMCKKRVSDCEIMNDECNNMKPFPMMDITELQQKYLKVDSHVQLNYQTTLYLLDFEIQAANAWIQNVKTLRDLNLFADVGNTSPPPPPAPITPPIVPPVINNKEDECALGDCAICRIEMKRDIFNGTHLVVVGCSLVHMACCGKYFHLHCITQCICKNSSEKFQCPLCKCEHVLLSKSEILPQPEKSCKTPAVLLPPLFDESSSLTNIDVINIMSDDERRPHNAPSRLTPSIHSGPFHEELRVPTTTTTTTTTTSSSTTLFSSDDSAVPLPLKRKRKRVFVNKTKSCKEKKKYVCLGWENV